jgi:hypothetical protein
MIAPERVQQVRQLLAEGKHSQRAIARIIGISRGTVGAIASGKRRDARPRRDTCKVDEFSQPTGPPERCPGCGAMVYMPCRLCRTRAAKSSSSRPSILSATVPIEEPIGLDLTDEHRKRYEEVRRRRLTAERTMLQPVEEEQPDFDSENVEPDFEDPVQIENPAPIEDPDFGNAEFWDDLQTTML